MPLILDKVTKIWIIEYTFLEIQLRSVNYALLLGYTEILSKASRLFQVVILRKTFYNRFKSQKNVLNLIFTRNFKFSTIIWCFSTLLAVVF